MSYQDRIAYTPENARETAVQRVDQAFASASNAFYNGVDEALDTAGYNLTHPREFADEFSDLFTKGGLPFVDEFRALYGTGHQWFNTIERITEDNCGDTWTLLVETALPAVGNTLFVLLTPNPSEILENYLEPKSANNHRRPRSVAAPTRRSESTSGRTRRSWNVVPDVDGSVAENLPGKDFAEGIGDGSGKRFLFSGIDIADRVAWYYMLLDLSENFLANWTSNIREASFASSCYDVLYASNWTYPGPTIYVDISVGGQRATVLTKRNATGSTKSIGFIDQNGRIAYCSGTFTLSVHANAGQSGFNTKTQYDIFVNPSFSGGTITGKTRDTAIVQDSMDASMTLSGEFQNTYGLDFAEERTILESAGDYPSASSVEGTCAVFANY